MLPGRLGPVSRAVNLGEQASPSGLWLCCRPRSTLADASAPTFIGTGGTKGQDTARIVRLAQQMCNSRAQTPSLAHPELPDPEWGSGFRIPIAPSRRSRMPGIARAINRITQPDRTPKRMR